MTSRQSRFRDVTLAKRVVSQIRAVSPSYPVKICHVCGTHEWTISHYGLRSLLPETVDVIAGPGCPVCIIPAAEIDEAIALALKGILVTCCGFQPLRCRFKMLERKVETFASFIA